MNRRERASSRPRTLAIARLVPNPDTDDVWRVVCGGPTRKPGQLCPMHLGTAIFKWPGEDGPPSVAVGRWYLAGDYYEHDGMIYRSDESSVDYFAHKISDRPPRRDISQEVEETYFEGIDLDDYSRGRTTRRYAIGDFPQLFASVICPHCNASNFVPAPPTPDDYDPYYIDIDKDR